jgi:DNA-binding response OmpR family regulator
MNSTYQRKKALVIDSSSIITKIIKILLPHTDFKKDNIFVAHDKNQVLIMFDLEKFKLVTLGIHLKELTGVDLL